MHSEFHHLLRDLISGDREFYFRFLRMNPERFEHFKNPVKKKFQKKTPKERLVLTIRCFAYRNVAKKFKFCFQNWKNYEHQISHMNGYKQQKSSRRHRISLTQLERQMENILEQTVLSTREAFTINCKGFYSFVLLAVGDGNCCFTLFDLGQYGNNNDRKFKS